MTIDKVSIKNESTKENKKYYWQEITVVLCIAVLPYIYWGIEWLVWPGQKLETPFIREKVSLMWRYLVMFIPVYYIVKLNSIKLEKLFLERIRLKQFVHGAVVGMLGLVIAVTLTMFLENSNAITPYANANEQLPISGIVFYFFTIATALVVSFVEEYIFRMYMYKRLTIATGREWVAIVLSILLYGMYTSLGTDWGNFCVAIGLGTIYMLSFTVFKSIWPGVVGHFLVDTIFSIKF